jgi:hypothetical protein
MYSKFFCIGTLTTANCFTNCRSQNLKLSLYVFPLCGLRLARRITIWKPTSSLLLGLAHFKPRPDTYYLTLEFLFQVICLINISGYLYSVFYQNIVIFLGLYWTLWSYCLNNIRTMTWVCTKEKNIFLLYNTIFFYFTESVSCWPHNARFTVEDSERNPKIRQRFVKFRFVR